VLRGEVGGGLLFQAWAETAPARKDTETKMDIKDFMVPVTMSRLVTLPREVGVCYAGDKLPAVQ
jgi:hypothetical protein